jgi:hypothetical protein
MKKIDGHWADENNNKWDCDKFTKTEAVELSKTILNCSDCFSCSDCCSCYVCLGYKENSPS